MSAVSGTRTLRNSTKGNLRKDDEFSDCDDLEKQIPYDVGKLRNTPGTPKSLLTKETLKIMECPRVRLEGKTGQYRELTRVAIREEGQRGGSPWSL